MSDLYLLDIGDTRFRYSSIYDAEKMPPTALVKNWLVSREVALDPDQPIRIFPNGQVQVYTSNDPTTVWYEFDGIDPKPTDSLPALLDKIEADIGKSDNQLLINIGKAVLAICNRDS